MAQIVPLSQVIPSGPSYNTTIIKMSHVLHKQGQIEPLQVAEYCVSDGVQMYVTHYNDPHGSDIALAAQRLGWTGLLVVVNTRYEE